jgi:hypothetical protein
MNATKEHDGMEAQLHAFQSFQTNGGRLPSRTEPTVPTKWTAKSIWASRKKKNTPCPYRESNQKTSVFQPVVSPLYRLIYSSYSYIQALEESRQKADWSLIKT